MEQQSLEREKEEQEGSGIPLIPHGGRVFKVECAYNEMYGTFLWPFFSRADCFTELKQLGIHHGWLIIICSDRSDREVNTK